MLNSKSEFSDIELYKILIDEVQFQHKRWIDNFRSIMFFNTLLIPWLSTIYLLKSKLDLGSVFIHFCFASTLSFVGIYINFALLLFINRINQITRLRFRELKKLEMRNSDITIRIFNEGQLLNSNLASAVIVYSFILILIMFLYAILIYINNVYISSIYISRLCLTKY